MQTLQDVLNAVATEGNEIEQHIAALFPEQFPLYPDDWPEPPWPRCVGDHIPLTMVMVACDEIVRLRNLLDEKGIPWKNVA